MEYKFKTKWDENTDISWWKLSRIELNKIIDAYNNWQIEGFQKDVTQVVFAKIQYGKQTIGSQNGGSGYLEELEEMEDFVNQHINSHQEV